MRFIYGIIFSLWIVPASAGWAQDNDKIKDLEQRIKKLEEQNEEQRKMLEEMRRDLRQEQGKKEPPSEEKKKLEEEFQKALGQDQKQAAPQTPSGPTAAPSLKLIDISLDLLGTGGASSVPESELRDLEAGGHDPKNRGFTVQNTELVFSGIVDPYFRGDANIVLQIDDAGESIIELEEVYLTTQELPYNLQVKAGQFFTSFGRINAIHPHAWDFVDHTVVNSRFLGPDGLRNPGVQVSWLTPLPFFAELTGSVQNAQGETAASFRGVTGETVAGRTLTGRDVRALQDMIYLLRLKTSFDPTDEITLVPGVSALFGPNATGGDTQTQIYGIDLYAKWKPLNNDKGWPFVGWTTEAMLRRYEAAAVMDSGIEVIDRETLEDWGMYSQVVWGFSRPWTLGVRYDYARGEDDAFAVAGVTYRSSIDPMRDRRQRESLALTYYPSEFSKIRLQYAHDLAQFLEEDDAHSVYLQYEIMFGAHGAHKF